MSKLTEKEKDAIRLKKLKEDTKIDPKTKEKIEKALKKRLNK